MSRAFKVGDVAMVEIGCWANRHVALFDGDGWCYGDDKWTANDPAIITARPLVVIDPEDAEAVERLIRLQDKHFDDHERPTVHADDRASMQAALREFADPKPPKPDEPTGLGAVVRDAEGTPWVRTENRPNISGHVWTSAFSTRRPDRSDHAEWSEIDAVEVLSEGVS